MTRSLVLPLLLALAGCGDGGGQWKGYALRDRAGEDGTRLVGAYATAAGCRDALLASASDPASEALVCTRGCPRPRDGLIADCAEAAVVRPIDVRALMQGTAVSVPAAP